ncbi:cupin domain-containing protein [Nitrosococcus wardiae]|uniref:Cupin domain-containing protein n=1 Tax=Nitrosococcus wardiae TaxID=1814290 RepID=A0A4P7C170_9GAMM|nr:cupin domain-containing protein [Nitrosococcus wardiae]QBQ55379.1 cupin domain-containing protein [Nitrosococcus wardiae]
MEIHNINSAIPNTLPEELYTLLLQGNSFRLERIVSRGHSTPAEQWLDQEQHEWVIVLSGSAGLLFAGEQDPHILRAGDYVHIPAHCQHRVAWTDPVEDTVWLAIHYNS